METHGTVQALDNRTFVLVSGHLYGISAAPQADQAAAPADSAAPAVKQEKHLCPGCRTGNLRRVRRNRLMRLVPESRHFACPFCQSTFLYFLGDHKIRLSRDRQERHSRMSLFGSRALSVHWAPGMDQ